MEEIFESLAKGDLTGLGEICRWLMPRVSRRSHWWGVEPTDVVQAAAERLLRQAQSRSFSLNGAEHARRYVLRTALNCAGSLSRKRSRALDPDDAIPLVGRESCGAEMFTLLADVWRILAVASAARRVSRGKQEALKRRYEESLGKDPVELLIRDERLSPTAVPVAVKAALAAEARLQRTAVNSLLDAVRRMASAGQIDADDAALAARFLNAMKHRKWRSTQTFPIRKRPVEE